MLIPEGGAPSEIVINQCVLQQVVTHVESVYGLTTDGQVRGGADLPLILEQLQDQLDDLRCGRGSADAAGTAGHADRRLRTPVSDTRRPRPRTPASVESARADVRGFIRDAKWCSLVMKERSGGSICASHVT